MVDRSKKIEIAKHLSLISQIGISMMVPILGGIFLGNFLDNIFNTEIIFLFICIILGIATSFISLFKLTTKENSKRK